MQELDLAKDAIFTQNTAPAARNRYIYYPDRLVRMPHPAFGFFNNLYSLWTEPIYKGVIWSSATELYKAARDPDVEDESVGDFLSRRFSKALVERIVSAILHGIYAGNVWHLSAKSLFPRLWRYELQERSVFRGMIKSQVEGLEIPKGEATYIQAMKKFQWEPILKATLKDNAVFTFRDGLSMLTDALARSLFTSGKVEFKTSTPVESVALAKDDNCIVVADQGPQKATTHTHVVSALAPENLNLLLHNERQRLIPSIPSVTVMTVNLYYRTPNLNPPGFGYLIPSATSFENNPERALGVVFDTAYSPSPADLDTANWMTQDTGTLKQMRDLGQLVNINDFAWYNLPEKANVQDEVKERGTKLTVMLGGHNWDGWPAYPDEQEGLALAKAVVERHLGITEEPEVFRVNLQRDCIPQYTVGHEQRLKTAHTNLQREYKGRLRVSGNWMWGVGVNDCLRSAWEVVRSIKDGTPGTGLEHVGANEYTRLKPKKPGESEETFDENRK
jgi:oxygen-dependent protoporphyrinogen oxidase